MTRRPWFTVRAGARSSDTADVDVLDVLGANGVTVADFVAAFDVLANRAKTVRLNINSPGGSAPDAVAMVDHLRGSGKQILVTVLGIAGGEAAYLAMAGGDRVVMPANSMLWPRFAVSGARGNATEIRRTAADMDALNATFRAAYAKRWKGDRKSLQALLTAEPFLSAAECQKLGLADAVEPEIARPAARFSTAKLPVKARQVFAPAGGHSPQSLWEEIHAMRKSR